MTLLTQTQQAHRKLKLSFHIWFTGFLLFSKRWWWWGQTQEQTSRSVEVFKAECKHATNGLWAQLESRAELLIASIILSQIKMSNSMKNAVPLCSLIIRGSGFLFHTNPALWSKKKLPRQENSCLCFILLAFLKQDIHLIIRMNDYWKAEDNE